MKFEQLLQIYWSKGFLFGGKIKSFNTNLNDLFKQLNGLNLTTKTQFIKRFEFTNFQFDKSQNFSNLTLDEKKIINMYLSQFLSINNNISELLKYNIIRLYLIKSFRGKAQALGKPCRGQRTWSNASSAYKTNKILRFFIHEIKKTYGTKKIVESKNLKIIKKKIKKSSSRFKIKAAKQKINNWF